MSPDTFSLLLLMSILSPIAAAYSRSARQRLFATMIEKQPVRNPMSASSTVLVVGSSRGIGSEFVRQCLEKGANVHATYRGDVLPTEIEGLVRCLIYMYLPKNCLELSIFIILCLFRWVAFVKGS